MKYTVSCCSKDGDCRYREGRVDFTANADNANVYFSVEFDFPEWEDDAYIMMPAFAYNGNRMKRVKRSYAPMYMPWERGEGVPPVIIDVPALNPDGSGEMQALAGDMAVPCVGIFYRRKRQAIFIYTEQELGGHDIGFCVAAGKVVLGYPAYRTEFYRYFVPSERRTDKGAAVKAGETLSSRIDVHCFDCPDMESFYRHFFETRDLLLKNERMPNMYTQENWDIMERHFNRDRYNETYGFYGDSATMFAPGWCGTGMLSPFLQKGSPETVKRTLSTLDFLCAHQAKSGFFYRMRVSSGLERVYPGSSYEDAPHFHTIRRSGDVLYYFFRHFALTEPKQTYVEAARRCADAFVKLYKTYGTFGQFVDIETGEMKCFGTTSGAIVPGALCAAYRFFGNKEYLEIAKKAGSMYYEKFLKAGLSYGGPGDALSAPDSESIFAFVESYMALYEETKDEQWIAKARHALHMASSWVMPYAYRFPDGSDFDKLQINTVGSVFANVQNKHSAPGICTHSGLGVYRLYEQTGDVAYLALLKDIASFIPQCMSREDRPIPGRTSAGKYEDMPAGYICERVNTSDWEGRQNVGTVFYGSCWCEISFLLTFTELIVGEGLDW